MIKERITSLELYTEFPAGEVVATRHLEDVACGMYPCFYKKMDDHITVSTSVVSLIQDAGDLELNTDFKPTKFFLHRFHRKAALRIKSLLSSLNKILKKFKLLSKPVASVKSRVSTDVKALYFWNPHQASYVSSRSIDRRITKLKPFEVVADSGSHINFKPDFSITETDYYIDESARLLTESVNEIEKRFPEKVHIILVGGKDSQLIALIPKLNNDKWYLFSAEPNYPLIKKWVADNHIPVADVFRHDGRNEETKQEFKQKVICGDLYTSPVHIRYAPRLKKLAESFNNECIFWLGTMPRVVHLYYGKGQRRIEGNYDPDDARKAFFSYHLEDFPYWQGNIHQTYTNYVGCPFLCPFYLEQIWAELFQRLDPEAIDKDMDYRMQLGEKLFGRPVKWLDKNPGPVAYDYNYYWFDTYKYYLRHIEESIVQAAG